MSAFSERALAYFASHAVDPAVAEALGVREEGGRLVYPLGRRRSLNGQGHTQQPRGEPLAAWWPCHRPERPGDFVLVCEGESDALAALSALARSPEDAKLRELPVLAVPGTGYPTKRLVDELAAVEPREVLLALDADDAGRSATARVTDALHERGLTVAPVELEDGEDLASYLARLPVERRGEWIANALCDAERARPPFGTQAKPAATGKAARNRRRVILTAANTITPEAVRWLWRFRLPLGGLSLIAGEPGLGKSTLTAELAADVTRGRLDGDLQGQPHDVLIATAEDHFASVVWGRLTAAGADLARVHRVHVEDRGEEELLTLPDDVAEIELRCTELAAAGRRVALVVVDPVAAFIGGSVDTHRDAAVRRVLAPLAGLAERQQLAPPVAHLTKDTAAKLLARVGGSVAFGAAPRSVLAFARHPDDPGGDRGNERVIVQVKSNHGCYAPALAARIEGREVEAVGSVSRLVIGQECNIGPDDLGAQTADDHHDRDAAAEWLADELADGQWHEGRQVKARGKKAGHSERTIQRVKQTLGIEDRREGFPAVGEWRLTVAPTANGATGATVGGATEQTRTTSGIGADSPPSRATCPGGGATGAEEPVTTPEHDDPDGHLADLADRLRAEGEAPT